MAKVTARWTGEKVAFDVDTASGHRVRADSDVDIGNDEGIRPTELMLAALATCTGVNVVLLLRKFRQPLASLSIEVDGDQEPEWPKRYTRIRLTFVPVWDAEPDAALVDRAIDLACNRYCPVDATLSHGTAIDVAVRPSPDAMRQGVS